MRAVPPDERQQVINVIALVEAVHVLLMRAARAYTACVRACVRAYVRACVCLCACACVRSRAYVCKRARACVRATCVCVLSRRSG
eukprot:5671596-Pleurochrysis_carterae.AAC.2